MFLQEWGMSNASHPAVIRCVSKFQYRRSIFFFVFLDFCCWSLSIEFIFLNFGAFVCFQSVLVFSFLIVFTYQSFAMPSLSIMDSFVFCWFFFLIACMIVCVCAHVFDCPWYFKNVSVAFHFEASFYSLGIFLWAMRHIHIYAGNWTKNLRDLWCKRFWDTPWPNFFNFFQSLKSHRTLWFDFCMNISILCQHSPNILELVPHSWSTSVLFIVDFNVPIRFCPVNSHSTTRERNIEHFVGNKGGKEKKNNNPRIKMKTERDRWIEIIIINMYYQYGMTRKWQEWTKRR